MLIISKFKDYYDPVAYQNGMDKSIVYERETKDSLLKEFVMSWFDRKKTSYFPSYWVKSNFHTGLYKFDTYLVGFCGKVYPLAVVRTRTKSGYYDMKEHVEYVYDLDVIRDLHKKYCNAWYKFDVFSDMITSKKVLDLFQTYKTPAFILSDVAYTGQPNFTVNPRLKDVQFYKVMDTVTAFQEVEMFVSQQLCTEKDTLNISDKDKIMGHGFDYKYSFRKEKE